MKHLKQHWAKLAAAIGVSAALLAFLIHNLARADAPALSIALTGTNQVTLTVTNGSHSGIYEIYWEEFLDPGTTFTNGAWIDVYSGTTGQTNFVLDLGDTWFGFFRAANTNDFDGDGILNYQDARPFDPAIGILRVTIESPANGSNVQ